MGLGASEKDMVTGGKEDKQGYLSAQVEWIGSFIADYGVQYYYYCQVHSHMVG